MASTLADTDGVVKCRNCPAIQTLRCPGIVHKDKWFCSYTCIREYEQDINEESPFWKED